MRATTRSSTIGSRTRSSAAEKACSIDVEEVLADHPVVHAVANAGELRRGLPQTRASCSLPLSDGDDARLTAQERKHLAPDPDGVGLVEIDAHRARADHQARDPEVDDFLEPFRAVLGRP